MSRSATGTIRKLPSGRYQARISAPDGQRHAAPTTFAAKRDAQVWVAQMSADISRGKFTAKAVQSSMAVAFGPYAERWVEERMVRGRPLADRTRAEYRGLLKRHVLPTWENKALHSITKADVRDWYAGLPDRPTTRAHCYALVRSILGQAVEDGHLPSNPLAIRGAGTTRRKRDIRPATVEEVEAVAAAMPEGYRLLVVLSAWMALRVGEATELRRSDIDARTGTLRISRAVVRVEGENRVKTPKSDAGRRELVIPRSLMPQVREHLLVHGAPGDDGLLFPSPGDPERHLLEATASKMFRRARTKGGRDDLTLHGLRHVGLTWYAESGATLPEVMAYAGHSTVAAALRYMHAASERRGVLADRLSDRYEGRRTGSE